jgi:hypothetical protein
VVVGCRAPPRARGARRRLGRRHPGARDLRQRRRLERARHEAAAAARWERPPGWRAASRGVAGRGCRPPEPAPLGLVGAAILAALVGFRPGERYGLAVVDGALLGGALVALAL